MKNVKTRIRREKRMTKKEIYSKYEIEYKDGRILSPVFGWINPLLINGNAKLGNGVWTWSTLPANKKYKVEMENNSALEVMGTCPCNCAGCYAQRGCYGFKSTKRSLARKTFLARFYPDFVKRAIMAQIEADRIDFCRIHAAGDFFSNEYVAMWREIVNACTACTFWTYTKNASAENAFDGCANCNVVKSLVPCFGMNYGHCDYIAKVYASLKAQGKAVYICRCGVDKNQHCANCKGCSKNEYVLFIEHGTSYHADKDPLFESLREMIEAQEKP